jgi:hypothetical protein
MQQVLGALQKYAEQYANIRQHLSPDLAIVQIFNELLGDMHRQEYRSFRLCTGQAI